MSHMLLEKVDRRRFDSLQLQGAEGEAHWESLLAPVTSPDRLDKAPFGGRIDAWMGQESMFCDIATSPQRTYRSATQLARGPVPIYAVMLIQRGQAHYRDGQHEHYLAVGDILIEDMSAPRALITDALHTLQLLMPCQNPKMPLPLGLNGTLLPRHQTTTRLLASHMRALRRVVDSLSLQAFHQQLAVAHSLLNAALPNSQRQCHDASLVNLAVRAEIERYIRTNLTSPQLNVDHLAKRFRLSRTQLYRLFKAAGGPATYIRLQRLCAAARALTYAASQLDKQHCVELYGFSSPEKVWREFEETFGFSFSDSWTQRTQIPATDETFCVRFLFERLGHSDTEGAEHGLYR